MNWEGSGEGRYRDRHDGMEMRAPTTLPTDKLSLESFIAE